MAKNREHGKPLESESESGEEEHDEESSEEESDSEPEPTQVSKKPSSTSATVKKTQIQSSSKPHHQQPPPSSSSDEEESGSESESDADGPDHNAMPVAPKLMEDPQKSNNPARNTRSKSNTSDLATPAKPTPAKRPAEEKETEVKDAKKSKKKKAEAEPENTEKKSSDDPKKLLFQRLWSEDDEIVILKGMIDYATKKKSDPVADLNAFHDFIKKNLHVDVTRTQLQDKIRRLKKKYENNKSKEKEGKDRTFSKPHEQKAYELSKKIWGCENGGEKVVGSPRSNGIGLRKPASKRVAENEEAKSVEERLLVPAAKKLSPNGVSVEERILRIGEELFEGEKEWKKLRVEEMEVHLRQLEVRTAQTKLVLDVLKSAADSS